MAKVNLTVQGELTAGQMRELNPHLRRKGLTLQEAVEKGLKRYISTEYLNMTVFLAAIEGVGVKLK